MAGTTWRFYMYLELGKCSKMHLNSVKKTSSLCEMTLYKKNNPEALSTFTLMKV